MAWRACLHDAALRAPVRGLLGEGVFACRLGSLQLAPGHIRRFSSGDSSAAVTGTPGSSWMPSWLRSRLPGFAGGDQDANQLANLDLDKYASSIKSARRMGALTGFAGGTSRVSDPNAQGGLRLQESIIGAMTPEERKDLTLFGGVQRQRVAASVGCTLAQVDDCMAKYLWVKQMGARMAELKRAGKPLPKTVAEVEQTLGHWRAFKEQSGGDLEVSAPAGALVVPADALEPKSKQPCPLAGKNVSRNTKCPLTSRRFKTCCGR